MMIACSGEDLQVLETSQKVRTQFGTSDTSEVVEGGRVEVFHTHRKIPDQNYDQELWLRVAVTTLGLSEVVTCPYETCRAVLQIVLGCELRVTYDAGGRVTKFEVDGQQIPWRVDGAGTPEAAPEAAKKARVP
jgi:hypothetical protein